MSKGTVFITGGARRVGKTIALALARDGYDIALHYNSSKHDAEKVLEKIHSIGVDCRLFSCDIKQTSQLTDMMNDVFTQCQGCNILINNASIFDRISFQNSNEQDFDDNFAVHVKAPYFLSQAFAQHCERGSIINMVDTKVHRTLTEYFAYTLSKKSLFELTKMLAKALAPKIRVNGIAPGYILPPVDGSETDVERVQNSIPLQRLGNPELIAQTVLYILSNPFMTGEVITVDGGERLKQNMNIKIEGIKAETIIGIHIHERKTKQPVFINLDIDLHKRPRRDDIDTTLDYETLTNEIAAYVEGTSYNLIESLVEDVLDIIMNYEIVKHASVAIEKPQALMTANNVIVTSHRDRF